MKKSVRNINEIKNIVSKMPKTLNEAIYEDYNDIEQEYPNDEEPKRAPLAPDMEDGQQMPAPSMEGGAAEAPAGDMGENSAVSDGKIQNFITNMRKESLEIMKALADNPDDSVYVFAKRIFQLADKAHEDQKEGKDINGQPKQQMNNPQQ